MPAMMNSLASPKPGEWAGERGRETDLDRAVATTAAELRGVGATRRRRGAGRRVAGGAGRCGRTGGVGRRGVARRRVARRRVGRRRRRRRRRTRPGTPPPRLSSRTRAGAAGSSATRSATSRWIRSSVPPLDRSVSIDVCRSCVAYALTSMCLRSQSSRGAPSVLAHLRRCSGLTRSEPDQQRRRCGAGASYSSATARSASRARTASAIASCSPGMSRCWSWPSGPDHDRYSSAASRNDDAIVRNRTFGHPAINALWKRAWAARHSSLSAPGSSSTASSHCGPSASVRACGGRRRSRTPTRGRRLRSTGAARDLRARTGRW